MSQSPLYHDPNWPRASAWLEGALTGTADRKLTVVGAPLNSSITPGRADLAPAAIRGALQRLSTFDLETGLDLCDLAIRDLGNVEVAGRTPEEAFGPISAIVKESVQASDAVVILGGDNAITRPAFHGLPSIQSSGLITLDAHLDLRDLSGGLMNGNPIRALLADGLRGENIIQIGIQPFANSGAYVLVASQEGIEIVTADEVHDRGIGPVIEEILEKLSERVEDIYVDLDLDVLDRSFAPATPGSRPGGLAPWQIRRAARMFGAHHKVRVMDLVEIDPTKDVADVTCLCAAACLLSFASGVLSR